MTRLLLAGLCLLPALPVQAADCLQYEPSQSTISGTLQRRIFPGSPNFEDLTTGDDPMDGYYLITEQPMCVAGNDTQTDVKLEDDVRWIQLAIDQQQYDSLRPYLEQKITLKGELFAAQTTYHFAPLLMESVELVAGQPGPAADCPALAERAERSQQTFAPPLEAKVHTWDHKERVYFHSAPDMRCKAKAFLISRDQVAVSAMREDGWVQASFTGRNGTVTRGWLDESRVIIGRQPEDEDDDPTE